MTQSQSDSKKYAFTAGHCWDEGGGEFDTRLASGDIRRVGKRHNSHFNTPGDIAIVRMSEDYWSPAARVFVRGGQDTTRNKFYPIRDDQYAAQNDRVCMSGRTTGTDCGYVSSVNTTHCYGGACVLYLLRATYCRSGGDSGGPVYAMNVAYGIHVAGGGGGCDAYFMSVKRSEDLMNVDVLHTN